MDKRLGYVLIVITLAVTLSKCNPIEDGLLQQRDETTTEVAAKTVDETVALRREIKLLEKRIDALENMKGYIASDDDDGDDEVKTGLYNDFGSTGKHTLRKRAIRRRVRRLPEVAFQATLEDESVTFKLYDAIKFNDVITNIGGAYNKHTGIFTAPFAGTYIFNTNIVSETGHYVEASVNVNDRVTVSAISDHRVWGKRRIRDIWDQGNAVAVLKLYKRDKVSVRVQWPEGSHVVHGVGKSSFSGYLLRIHEQI